jgi:hypothetical protein
MSSMAASLWVTKERYDKGFEAVLLKDMKIGFRKPGLSKSGMTWPVSASRQPDSGE